MNIIPWLLAGGGIYWFSTKKKSTPASPKNTYPTIGSKDIGYEIFNCNNLVIYDKTKAFTYASVMGANEATKALMNPGTYTLSPEPIIMGNCFEQFESENFETEKEKEIAKQKAINLFKKLLNSKEKLKFIFEMHKHFQSGVVKVIPDHTEDALSELNSMKEKWKKLGIDTSDLIVVLY